MSKLSAFHSLTGTVRWLHTYVSLLGFAAILFFGVTGLTLNHAGYFEGDEPATRTLDGELATALVGVEVEPDKLAVVETLRARHALHGALYDFAVDPDRLTVVFKAPGYSADATVERDSGRYSLIESRLGSMAVLDDLHKGRDSGGGWSLVIDVAAIVTSLSALTGLWLVLYVRRRRRIGIVVALIGTAVLAAVWAAWVP